MEARYLGRALRRLRHRLDLTQVELARRSGVAAKHICSYERGHVQPRQATLLRLLGALGVGLGDLEQAARLEALEQEMAQEHRRAAGEGDEGFRPGLPVPWAELASPELAMLVERATARAVSDFTRRVWDGSLARTRKGAEEVLTRKLLEELREELRRQERASAAGGKL
jgi:transcriptional regulator with XRE-family HTH domain